ncbi:MAG: hypothetical protein Q8P13_02550 [bacterium]|nr:hypothetical protein [bacterium]
MKFKICVSGAAAGETLNRDNAEKAKELGRAIAARDCILITGATTGLPHYAAVGCKEAKGISIGFSPASTYQDHVYRYHLPVNYFDLIVYTGFGYSGRNLILTRSADAVVTIGGRMGTLNEFTVAFEDRKPLAVLEETGGMADEIKELTEIAHKHQCSIIYDTDPDKLIGGLIADLRQDRHHIREEHRALKVDQPE